MQAFLEGAGRQGVLLASLGTIAELGEPQSVCSLSDYHHEIPLHYNYMHASVLTTWAMRPWKCRFSGAHVSPSCDTAILTAGPERISVHADRDQLASMAAAFARLPCKVLWRLTAKEVPDQAAIAALNLANNTKVPFCLPLRPLINRKTDSKIDWSGILTQRPCV